MFYTLASLLLGLLAWGLGIAAIVRRGRTGLVFGSLAACAVSLTVQFFEIAAQASEGDSAWFYDVTPTLAKVAALLTIVTITLNTAALWKASKRSA